MTLTRPLISMIAAVARNRAIGAGNALPWHIPADLKRFKALTAGKPMVMGRKTFDSLPGVLPGRLHIVVSRAQSKSPPRENVVYVASLEAGLREAQQALLPDQNEVFIIGGGQIYAQGLTLADTLYLTHIELDVPEADAFFPALDEQWEITEEEGPFQDEKSQILYSYRTYSRRNRLQDRQITV